MNTNLPPLPDYLPGGAPQFYPGNRTGCLLVHGFMASPPEIGWLGHHLAQQGGYTVLVPRLPGHGNDDPALMHRMRWQDWYLHLLDQYQTLRQQCDRVFVVGHSMGGLLAMLLASAHPVDGLVIAASPMRTVNRIMPYAHWLSWFVRMTDHPSEPWLDQRILDEQKRRQQPLHGRVHHRQWATRAIYELYQLIQIAPQYLPRVTAPVLLLYAENDLTVTLDHMQDAMQAASNSTHLETYCLKAGDHVIFQDEARDEAFAVVRDFIARMVTTTTP